MADQTNETYTYDPRNIATNDKDRMRFELGDVITPGAENTAMLSDQEITAVVGLHRSWRRAKLVLAESVLMRLSYEVNTSVGGMSLSMDQRFNHWQALVDRLKKEVGHVIVPPNLAPVAGTQSDFYFHENMQANERK